jgi:phosphomannomutase
LEFGTGGLRGIMGAGSNRMNIYTVGAATQGLANYLKLQFPDVEQISIVVGYDCRNNSPYFSQTVADIFSANGMKVYLFDSLRPTPEISFAIRHFGCQSGVMITASHNPKEYNGYKAYWNDGAQLVAPHDVDVIKEVNKITNINDIRFGGEKTLEILKDKTRALIVVPYAQPKLKVVAEKWLAAAKKNSITDGLSEEYIKSLEENVATIDGAIAALESMGAPFAEKLEWARAAKAAGAKFCGCEACSLAFEIRDYLRGKIQNIGEDVDNIFIEKLKSLSLSPDSIKQHGDLKIVYTPIHGTGAMLIPRALKEYGFENVIKVDEQFVLSGDFPTVVSPNPEEPAALDLAIKKAKIVDADIVMASDPDADRLGIAVKNEKGEWVLINGNQTCLVFIYYLLTKWKELGKLTGNEYIVKTIVTTEIIKDIAEKAGVEMFDCFTGFKWIAAVMRENEGKKTYIGGGEESYGFLAETFCRDKDAVSACALMAEITAWAKDNGKTWFEMLQDLYIEYGYGKEKGISVVRKGQSGAAEIKQMMSDYRANPPREIAGSQVVKIKDFQTLKQKDLKTGTETDLQMPATSNVLQFFTEDGTKISVRPSGTEPKIKFYIEVRGEMKSRADFVAAEATAETKIGAVRKSLGV